MSNTIIWFRFDRQDGNHYYFQVGFFNEGLQFPSFGSDPLQKMFPMSDILGLLPLRLYQGNYIGDYLIPTNLLLRGAKSKPNIAEDLLDDILVVAEPLAGFLFPDFYEVLYTPHPATYPTDYDDARDDSTEYGGQKYFIPNEESNWPEQYEESEYENVTAGASVTLEGAFLQSGYEWLFAGSEDDPDTGILTRIWGSPEHAPQFTGHFISSISGYTNLWAVYNENYPQYPFLGLTLPKPKVDIFSPLNATFPFPVYQNTGVVIPLLDPVKTGDQISAFVPRCFDYCYVFPGSEVEPASEDQVPFLPVTLMLPMAAVLTAFGAGNPFSFIRYKFTKNSLTAPTEYYTVVNESDYMVVNESDRVLVNF